MNIDQFIACFTLASFPALGHLGHFQYGIQIGTLHGSDQTVGHMTMTTTMTYVCATYTSCMLFEGGVYFTQSFQLCSYYLRVATIQGYHLFKEIWSLRVATIQGYHLFKEIWSLVYKYSHIECSSNVTVLCNIPVLKV